MLLAERCAAVRRDADVAPVADSICERLDDLPLAIELAASRLRVMSPGVLAARLDRALSTLGAGPRDGPERQQTLRATIAWSVELLDESARHVFAQLGVFAGGCSVEAAASVSDGDLDTLEALAEHSLVRQRDDRFSMLATVRQYALEMLHLSGDRESTTERYIAWYARLAERTLSALYGDVDPDELRRWYVTLDVERDNLQEAFDQAVARGDLSSASGIAPAAAWYWEDKGQIAAQRPRLDALAEALDAREPDARTAPAVRSAALFAMYQNDDAVMLRHAQRLRRFGGGWASAADYFCWQAMREDEARAAALERRAYEVERSGADTWNVWGHMAQTQRALDSGDDERALVVATEALDTRRTRTWRIQREIMRGRRARVLVSLRREAEARNEIHAVADFFFAVDPDSRLDEILLWLAEAWERDDPPRAAALLAAFLALTEAAGVLAGPEDAELCNQLRDGVRGRMLPEEFEAAWTGGSRSSAAEAVELSKKPIARDRLDGTYDLTRREREVLLLVCEGCSNADIARRLVISPNTVSIHVSRVLRNRIRADRYNLTGET